VRALLGASPYHADDVVCELPPANGLATVEKVAINAAMAGCEPAAFPWVVAALEAISAPGFNLVALATTTSSVFPALIVNGPSRARLGIDMGAGCMGGAAGRGSATIGRAVALCMRNIGGQRVGDTSKSVFGQPARASGLCFGEWEEESPWPSLAVQRGFGPDQDVVSAHGSKGTLPMADLRNDDPRDLLHLLARSMAYPTANKLLMPWASAGSGEVVLALNPVWAKRIATVFGTMSSVQEFLVEHAWQPIDVWPEASRAYVEASGRVDPSGRVPMCEAPEQFVVVVCGGQGSLHAICLPSWGESQMQSAAVVEAGVPAEDAPA